MVMLDSALYSIDFIITEYLVIFLIASLGLFMIKKHHKRKGKKLNKRFVLLMHISAFLYALLCYMIKL